MGGLATLGGEFPERRFRRDRWSRAPPLAGNFGRERFVTSRMFEPLQISKDTKTLNGVTTSDTIL